nr:helix-turn-helix domain-containing protein [Kibdelosporangium sp. MJ126-NF4]CEL19694.1 hypothetical protein [Kibdelosporangium sp. MJ126-NF4]CTQ96919.1 hypothetical protein [Kibdelosporangium sp. MJ126-NF4]
MQNEGNQPDLVNMLRQVLGMTATPAKQEEAEERTEPYKVRELAKALNVNVSTIYRDIESGKLPSIRVGAGRGTYRVEVEDFAEYRKRLKSGGVAKPDGEVA